MIQANRIIVDKKSFLTPKKEPSPAVPSLIKGEIVEGRVLKAISSNRAILLLKGQALVAKTQIPLQSEGRALYKVVQVTPDCVLKSIADSGNQCKTPSLLFRGPDRQGMVYKSLIDIMAPLIKSVKSVSENRLEEFPSKIWRLFGRMALAPEKPVNPHFLKSVVDSSGMLWENKIKKLLLTGIGGKKEVQTLIENDLKGLALGALRDNNATSLISSGGLSRFIDSLEQLQLANITALEDKGRLLFMIPIQSNDSFRFAQLLFDLSKKRKGDGDKEKNEKALAVTIFLDMSRIGPIRVDASVCDKEIRICFLVCNEDIQSVFIKQTDDLQRQLERHGFSVQQIICRLEEKPILEGMSLVDSLVDLEDHVFSVVI